MTSKFKCMKCRKGRDKTDLSGQCGNMCKSRHVSEVFSSGPGLNYPGGEGGKNGVVTGLPSGSSKPQEIQGAQSRTPVLCAMQYFSLMHTFPLPSPHTQFNYTLPALKARFKCSKDSPTKGVCKGVCKKAVSFMGDKVRKADGGKIKMCFQTSR